MAPKRDALSAERQPGRQPGRAVPEPLAEEEPFWQLYAEEDNRMHQLAVHRCRVRERQAMLEQHGSSSSSHQQQPESDYPSIMAHIQRLATTEAELREEEIEHIRLRVRNQFPVPLMGYRGDSESAQQLDEEDAITLRRFIGEASQGKGLKGKGKGPSAPSIEAQMLIAERAAARYHARADALEARSRGAGGAEARRSASG